MFLFCFATVRERVRPAVQDQRELKNDLKDVWKNDQWVRNSAPDPVQRLPGLYPHGGHHVLRHLGDGPEHPFRHAVYQPGRGRHDARSVLAKVLTTAV